MIVVALGKELKLVLNVSAIRPILSIAEQEPRLWRGARRMGTVFLVTDLCRH